MTTIAPNKITLTCTITGKQTTWLNRALIQKAIDKHGSLEAFMAQYVSRGAKKKDVPVKAKVIKPILEQGIALGKMSTEEYTTKYVTRSWIDKKDGSVCTVIAPAA